MDPRGPVTPMLFPGEGVRKIAVRLTQWIANALVEPAVVASDPTRTDAMVYAHVLMTTFDFVATRMSAQPLSVTVTEKGGHGYNMEQIRNMRALAAKYRADFEALIVAVGTVKPGPTPGTMAVPTQVQW